MVPLPPSYPHKMVLGGGPEAVTVLPVVAVVVARVLVVVVVLVTLVAAAAAMMMVMMRKSEMGARRGVGACATCEMALRLIRPPKPPDSRRQVVGGFAKQGTFSFRLSPCRVWSVGCMGLGLN